MNELETNPLILTCMMARTWIGQDGTGPRGRTRSKGNSKSCLVSAVKRTEQRRGVSCLCCHPPVLRFQDSGGSHQGLIRGIPFLFSDNIGISAEYGESDIRDVQGVHTQNSFRRRVLSQPKGLSAPSSSGDVEIGAKPPRNPTSAALH